MFRQHSLVILREHLNNIGCPLGYEPTVQFAQVRWAQKSYVKKTTYALKTPSVVALSFIHGVEYVKDGE